ncbi:hypothetical protein KDM41_11010 [bacterium]|nr:hypothetical protein [bacterium]
MMMRNHFAIAIGLVLACGLAGAASAQFFLPDWELSTAQRTYAGPEMVSVMHVPDGSGDPFAAAQLPGGAGSVDATIVVTLVDPVGNPVQGYPAEDVWVEAADGGVAYCAGGNFADGPTDASGVTTFTGARRGGGSSESLLLVYVSGVALTSNAGLAITSNSPDLNGDGTVNLVDVVTFAGHYGGTYAYAADLHYDQQINLADVVRLAHAWGASCP